MAQEIERRFLITGLSSERPPSQKIMNIQQGYVGTKVSGKSFRVRIIDNREGVIEFKSGKGIAREEKPFGISLELAQELMESWCCHSLSKIRFVIDGWAIDVFADKLNGITTAEKEFSSVQEAEKLVLPDWLLGPIEITDVLTSHRLAKIAASNNPTDGVLLEKLLSPDLKTRKEAVIETASSSKD